MSSPILNSLVIKARHVSSISPKKSSLLFRHGFESSNSAGYQASIESEYLSGDNNKTRLAFKTYGGGTTTNTDTVKMSISETGVVDIYGSLDMNGGKISNLGSPNDKKDATTKEYVDGPIGTLTTEVGKLDTSMGLVVFQQNGVLLSDLSANGFKITSLADPVDNQDAATKAYVNSVIPSSIGLTTYMPTFTGIAFTNLVYSENTYIKNGSIVQATFRITWNSFDITSQTVDISLPTTSLISPTYKYIGDVQINSTILGKVYQIFNNVATITFLQKDTTTDIINTVNWSNSYPVNNATTDTLRCTLTYY